MAISAAITLNPTSVTPSQLAYASLVVANSGAAAVNVTNVQLQVTPLNSNAQSVGVNSVVVPIGPGITTSVPAAGSITIGPFPIAPPKLSHGGTFYQLGSPPPNINGAMPLQETLSVGALVYTSDGAVTQAASMGLLVSYIPPPPIGTMGGVLVLSAPSNSLAMIPGWP